MGDVALNSERRGDLAIAQGSVGVMEELNVCVEHDEAIDVAGVWEQSKWK